jgi:hypothetical protein
MPPRKAKATGSQKPRKRKKVRTVKSTLKCRVVAVNAPIAEVQAMLREAVMERLRVARINREKTDQWLHQQQQV